MMTLEEAIEHAEDIAASAIGCECREEHRQLVEWLRELQETRKERDYWREKANSYEQTIFKLTDSISKQPEIIRCKDCKFSSKCDDDMSDIFESYGDEVYCSNHDIYLYKGWYCGDAERRTDGSI